VKRRTVLPPIAERYLLEVPRHSSERVVVLLHRWLARSGRALRSLRGADVEEFVNDPTGRRKVHRLTANAYRYEARLYLHWLAACGLAGPFDEGEFSGRRSRALPETVRRYLRQLSAIRQPATVKQYRLTLRNFHEWLASVNVEASAIDRAVCLRWVVHLHERGLHPSTRFGLLLALRKYLDWLITEGLLPPREGELIENGDLPKRPDYLPRPLPPATDQLLQSRLREANTQPALGLSVMRRTGLRLGELQRLERECLRENGAGQTFLKVPLGKMLNERLVPLDATTLGLVRELRSRARPESQWLIEGARQRPLSAQMYRAELSRLGGDLPLPEKLTSHRLRHTFATSLLSGGMSLTGIMRLLGHRDQRMTLRYAQIGDETVGREYFEALNRVSERYDLARGQPDEQRALDPDQVLRDLARWVTKHLCQGRLEAQGRLVLRRLEALRLLLVQFRESKG
jgi:integrase/recombinase XerD